MRHKIVLAGIGVLLSGAIGALAFAIQMPSGLHVTFFDIGQGDAALITSPSGKTMLIDTGPHGALIARKLAERLPWYRPTIDLLVLTHPDQDHIGGTPDVIAQYEIGGVLMPHYAKETALFENITALLRERSIPVLFGSAGDVIDLGGGATFSVLWPERPTEQTPRLNANNNSIVGLLAYKDDTFFFTGDIEERIERIMPHLSSVPRADVLKVGHHGSRTSTSEAFLRAVGPALAVLSVGENTYGHPHDEVLDRMRGTTLLRTDINGDITLISDGNNF